MLLINALLSQKGLQELLNVAAKVMGNPIFVSDRSNHAIAASETKYVEDTGWNMINLSVPDQGLGVREACLEEIMSSGAVDATFRAEHPYVQQFSFSTFRYISYRLTLQSLIIGQMVMIECFTAYTEEEEELFVFIARILSEEMRHYGNPKMQIVPYYRIFSELLESNHKISMKQLVSRTSFLDITFPAVSRLILVEPVFNEMKMQLFHLRDLFLQHFTGSLSIVKDTTVVLVIDGRQNMEEIRAKLNFVVKRYNVRIGVSSLSYSPLELNIAFLQAESALNIGGKFSPKERVFCYPDWATRHWIDCACQTCPPEVFYSPKFQLLLSYDRENNTSFTNDLMVYFANGKNIMQAAGQLNIHKNSMYYRLAKIEDICGCSLKDYQASMELQISVYFYQERLLYDGEKYNKE